MRILIVIILMLLAAMAHGQTHTMPGSNVVPSGATLTIQSGGTINAAAGSTVTGFGSPLQWDGGATNLVAATGRTSLALVVGTNVQAWDTDLDVWATKTPYAGTLTVTTGKTFNATGTLTYAGTDGSTLNIGSGGTLGTAAYTSAPAVYAAASPPTVDVGLFTIVKTGVNLKAAGTTVVFTVPTSRRFLATKVYAVVTAVTSAGSGTQSLQVTESGASGGMIATGVSGAGTPAVGNYYSADTPPASGRFISCAAGNNVQIVIATSHAGSTAVTGDIFVQGFYTQ